MSIKDDAEELGITVDEQWSDEMIQDAIDEKLNEDAESPKKAAPKKAAPKKAKTPGKVINNISGVRFKVYGRIVQPGCSHEPTARDLADVKGGKRIENAIKKGYLKRG
jgi:hypothetical protein